MCLERAAFCCGKSEFATTFGALESSVTFAASAILDTYGALESGATFGASESSVTFVA
ncbi:MAG: hypothetical protein U1C33_01925 [Candidatus Cloacimonadaceae bacterium]|nr:hypothetical protein [Candidatus Cloacimonadaceae bacterium]